MLGCESSGKGSRLVAVASTVHVEIDVLPEKTVGCAWSSSSSKQQAAHTSCPDHPRRVGPSVPDIAPRPRDRQGFVVARPKFFTGLSSGGNSSAWQVGSALHAIRRQGGPKYLPADATANGKWQMANTIVWYACRQVKEANEHCIASVSAKMSS
ncbi:unnamed protein product [Heterotrigona itama]|uniref:Uncharacterized protein n=1 Tax=Heterotrigona itama TaxID=395501 RepID=A0A6V7H968_9HYME|nr:unnamed protein product [Heterotrigona itama]